MEEVYKTAEVIVKNTNSYDIARALAYLSGFNNYQAMTRNSNLKGAGCEGVIFHEETIKESPDLFMLALNPDIMVTPFLGDKYLIEHNNRVPEYLVKKVEEEIQRVYSRV